jgi:sugar (pentulose or hexulose) kinase
METKYICGIDIGTTNIKGAIYSSNGILIAKNSIPYNSYTPKEKYHEQDPSDWIKGLVSVLENLLLSSNDIKNNLEAISLSTQGGTIVPVDKDFNPLCRAITWLDRRGEEILEERKDLQEKNTYFYEKSGWRLDSGISFLALEWLKKNKNSLFKKIHKVLYVNDYVLKKITGNNIQDPSNASITLFYNIKDNKWDSEILELIGFDSSKFSEIKYSGEIAGFLNKNLCKQLGLNPGVKLINGGHDQYCCGIGAGIFNEEEILIATGTAWVIFKMLEKPVFDNKNFFAVGRNILRDRFGFIYSIPSAGASLNWFAKKMMNLKDEKELFEMMNCDYKIISKITNQIIYHPYLTGAFGPDFDMDRRADFLNIDMGHSFRDMSIAIMEGVCFQLRKVLEVMKNSNIYAGIIKMSGGGARSTLWQHIVSNITGLKILIPQNIDEDLAVKGAAIIAGWGSGIFDSPEKGFKIMNSRFRPVYPENEKVNFYNRKYKKF